MSSIDKVKEVLAASGLSLDDLRRAMASKDDSDQPHDDPYVQTIRLVIQRQDGQPVRERKLRQSEVNALSFSESQKLAWLTSNPDHELNVAGHNFEDIRRALAAL